MPKKSLVPLLQKPRKFVGAASSRDTQVPLFH